LLADTLTPVTIIVSFDRHPERRWRPAVRKRGAARNRDINRGTSRRWSTGRR